MNNNDMEMQIKRSKRKVVKNRLYRICLSLLFILLLAIIIFISINRNAFNIFSADEVSESSLSDTGNSASDVNDWNLILVNPWSYLPEDFEVSLTQLKNGHSVDERCYPDLQEMMDDCRSEGLNPLICSSYRSIEKQEQLFNNKVDSLISDGYTEALARDEAATAIALPGTSEHHTGLALDIVDENNQILESSQADTAAQKWLMQNSWKYGFILRYPKDKTDITGIQYEPWHYRYVGKEAAKEIFEQGICLEEYLQQ